MSVQYVSCLVLYALVAAMQVGGAGLGLWTPELATAGLLWFGLGLGYSGYIWRNAR